MHNTYIYMLLMIATTYAVRVLPLTVIRKQFKNSFIRSFLFYVPYVTLAVMTFPAIMEATRYPVSGFFALILGIVLAWCGLSLFQVSAACCVLVFIFEGVLEMIGV